MEKDRAGDYLSTKECYECPTGTYPGPSGPVYACVACPEGMSYDTSQNPWKCTCDLTLYIASGGTCVSISESQTITSNYPVNSAKTIQFTDEELQNSSDGTITINSDTIDYLYLNSGYQCLKDVNSRYCQILANLCVLQMYDQTNVVCKLYLYLNNLRPTVANSE